MSVLDSLTRQAGRLATDVQHSLKRARLEGERRLLQRQHRGALEELGERCFELVRSGAMPEGELGPEVAAVEAKLMEIEAKVAEIDATRAEDEAAEGSGEGSEQVPPSAADVAFPMVGDEPGGGGGPDAGPGWDAAEKFFKKD
jgi:hypothetical protein